MIYAKDLSPGDVFTKHGNNLTIWELAGHMGRTVLARRILSRHNPNYNANDTSGGSHIHTPGFKVVFGVNEEMSPLTAVKLLTLEV